MNTALLFVDIQKEYFQGGKRELVGSEAAAAQARRLLDRFRAASLPVVFIQHLSVQPGASAFLPGTAGAELYPGLEPQAGEALFQKHYPNSFRDTPLLNFLHRQEVGRLVIAGMMTSMCVDATVRAAFDLGFECLVADDACATCSLAYGGINVPAAHVHAAFLAALQSMYGKVLGVDEILALV